MRITPDDYAEFLWHTTKFLLAVGAIAALLMGKKEEAGTLVTFFVISLFF